MREVKEQGTGAAGLVTPARVDGLFDDPGVIRRMAERNGPYRTMASYLPDSAVPGRRATPAKACRPTSGRPGRRAAVRW